MIPNLIERLEAFNGGNLNAVESLTLFCDLLNTEEIYRLAGAYDRIALNLIEAGLIRKDSAGTYRADLPVKLEPAHEDEAAEWLAEAEAARWNDDPSPYAGTYSEE